MNDDDFVPLPPLACELSFQPVFIDGRAVCHACGWAVKAALIDDLWVFVPHDCDGTQLVPDETTETVRWVPVNHSGAVTVTHPDASTE